LLNQGSHTGTSVKAASMVSVRRAKAYACSAPWVL
jgi:hypothetical protein